MNINAPQSKTYETKIHDFLAFDFLRDYSRLYGKLSRKLFVDLIVKGREANELKREYIAKHKIPGRIFNAIRKDVEAEIEAYWTLLKMEEKKKAAQISKYEKKLERARKRLETRKRELKERIGLSKNIKSINKRNKARKTQEEALENARRDVRSFQRAIDARKARLLKIAKIKAKGVPSILFGGRVNFRKQFNLEINELENQNDWKRFFANNRDSDFYSVGSGDESFGNQNIQYDPIKGVLRIVVPKALRHKHGDYAVINDVAFSYGKKEIMDAHLNKRSLTHRIKNRTEKNDWYLLTCPKPSDIENGFITDPGIGSIGVDLNRHHLSVTETNRHGNFVRTFDVPMELEGKNVKQREAVIGDAVKTVTDYAAERKKPIVIESLDFAKKKSGAKKGDPFTKFIMQFSYAKFASFIRGACFRKRIELREVNPAYTSLQGLTKYSKGLGITTHQAAAMVIARRGFGISRESLRTMRSLQLPGGDDILSDAKRNRGKHNWSNWSVVHRQARVIRDYCHGLVRPTGNSRLPIPATMPERVKASSPGHSSLAATPSRESCLPDAPTEKSVGF